MTDNERKESRRRAAFAAHKKRRLKNSEHRDLVVKKLCINGIIPKIARVAEHAVMELKTVRRWAHEKYGTATDLWKVELCAQNLGAGAVVLGGAGDDEPAGRYRAVRTSCRCRFE
jgi:hypothetical protein